MSSCLYRDSLLWLSLHRYYCNTETMCPLFPVTSTIPTVPHDSLIHHIRPTSSAPQPFTFTYRIPTFINTPLCLIKAVVGALGSVRGGGFDSILTVPARFYPGEGFTHHSTLDGEPEYGLDCSHGRFLFSQVSLDTIAHGMECL